LAFNLAHRFAFSGQAVSTRGLSFAFFLFCSLFVTQPLPEAFAGIQNG
jgi:hypothetical protein